MLVDRPLMVNSFRARSARSTATWKLRPRQVIFTSSESKFGVMVVPTATLPSRRTPAPPGDA